MDQKPDNGLFSFLHIITRILEIERIKEFEEFIDPDSEPGTPDRFRGRIKSKTAMAAITFVKELYDRQNYILDEMEKDELSKKEREKLWHEFSATGEMLKCVSGIIDLEIRRDFEFKFPHLDNYGFDVYVRDNSDEEDLVDMVLQLQEQIGTEVVLPSRKEPLTN